MIIFTHSPLQTMLGCSLSLESDLQGGAQTLCSAAESGLFCGDRALTRGGPIH